VKNTGYLTPPTPTTGLSSCASSEDGSPPSSTLSLYGQPNPMYERRPSNAPMYDRAPCPEPGPFELGHPTPGFTLSTNPPSPRTMFKQGDWICLTPSCNAHNFGYVPASGPCA
jgi:hypothetical protein